MFWLARRRQSIALRGKPKEVFTPGKRADGELNSEAIEGLPGSREELEGRAWRSPQCADDDRDRGYQSGNGC